MIRKVTVAVFGCILMFVSGCVTIGDINQAMRRVDRVWQAEYQQTEDEYRLRAVDANYELVYEKTRKAFVASGMAVVRESMDEGFIRVESNGPTPLTLEEWGRIAETEEPRVKQIGGWMLTVKKDAKEYTVRGVALFTARENKTLILLEFELDAPKYREMGLDFVHVPPPAAVKIGATRFWNELSKRLAEDSLPPPRMVSRNE